MAPPQPEGEKSVMAPRLRVRVDANKCVGSTMCVQIASTVFALNEKRQSTVTNSDEALSALIREAAEQCPVGAIILEDGTTSERLLP